MAKGAPRRPEDVPMRFSSIHVPLALNIKNASSNYLKSESQTIWARNTPAAANKRKRVGDEVPAETSTESKRLGDDVIVIHPGSRFLRIGRASDPYPVTVPHVIARKLKDPVPEAEPIQRIPRFNEATNSSVPVMEGDRAVDTNDDFVVLADPEDPVDTKVASIKTSLRSRMRFYKLRAIPNGSEQAASYNAKVVPEIIPERNDAYKVDWLDPSSDTPILIGSQVFRIADPVTSRYSVRWPIRGSRFNNRDYTSQQLLLSDIEAIWSHTLQTELKIPRSKFKDFSAVLVVPDYYDKFYIRELMHLLLVVMGFKRATAQPESVSAASGCGLSSACVVDIGAVKTSVCCMEDGLILPDTRMALDFGTDDITEFLYVLLRRINFPYKEAELNRSYDWNLMEDLKSKVNTLDEVDVAPNTYDFYVRAPGKDTAKYHVKTYDEITIAPMCLFEPRIIDFDAKRKATKPLWSSEYVEDMDITCDQITNAMDISTQHLIPPLLAAAAASPSALADTSTVTKFVTLEPNDFENKTSSGAATAAVTPDASSAPVAMEGVESSAVPTPAEPVKADDPAPAPAVTLPKIYPGGVPIDIRFEASKLPLDVAIFNSIRAGGGMDKIKKFLQVVLVVGGGALTPGMVHALESRLQAIAFPLVPGIEKVQVASAPKDIDSRIITWKGASVLARLDSIGDYWVSQADWDVLGMRALKERSLFL